METYSPRAMDRCTSASAWVSTSSVWNTLRMLSRVMTLVVGLMWCAFDVGFPSPTGRRWPEGPDEGARRSDASGSAPYPLPCPSPTGRGVLIRCSLQFDATVFVPLAGIGQDDLVAGFQSTQHLHAIDRGAADAYRYAGGRVAVGFQPKQAEVAAGGSQRGTPYRQHVVQFGYADAAVDGKIGPRTRRQRAGERDIHPHAAVAHGRIDAFDLAGDHA